MLQEWSDSALTSIVSFAKWLLMNKLLLVPKKNNRSKKTKQICCDLVTQTGSLSVTHEMAKTDSFYALAVFMDFLSCEWKSE